MRAHSLWMIPALVATLPVQAQVQTQAQAPTQQPLLSELFRDARTKWDQALEKGNGLSVRAETEALLSREALAVSRTDYNEMRVVLAVRDYAARSSVLEGDWEAAVEHLQQASVLSRENFQLTEETFNRIRKEHEAKLSEWKTAIQKQEEVLKNLETQTGLTNAQMQYRTQIQAYLTEHRAAIAHSEWSLKEMEQLLAQLQKERDVYQNSHASWQQFLQREQQEITQAASLQGFVLAKLNQLKGGASLFDRMSHAKRLQKLSPGNKDVEKAVSQMMGADGDLKAVSAKPKAVVKRKGSKRK